MHLSSTNDCLDTSAHSGMVISLFYGYFSFLGETYLFFGSGFFCTFDYSAASGPHVSHSLPSFCPEQIVQVWRERSPFFLFFIPFYCASFTGATSEFCIYNTRY